MLGQSKTAYQAEIDAACELIDFWRFNVHFARQILAEQPPPNTKGIWNRTDHRPLEGFVYAITPFNFTAIARQPADRAGADGQHRRVEALADPAARRAAHDGAARGGRSAARASSTWSPATASTSPRSPCADPRPGRHPLHRLDADVPAAVAQVGRQPRPNYRDLPAPGRRDRRQGLRPGPPERRPRRAAHGDDPRRVRVPGPEVLGGLARLRAAQRCGARSSDDLVVHHRLAADGRRHRPVELHGRRHRRPRLRQAQGRHRPGARDRGASTSSPAARTTTRWAGSCGRRSSRATTPTDESFTHRVLRPDPVRARLPRPPVRQGPATRWSRAAPYGLTGSIIAQDRAVIADATRAAAVRRRQLLRQRQAHRRRRRPAAVRRGRASGTNDKAGAAQNLLRWTSARSIKETFVPPTSHAYPHMG